MLRLRQNGEAASFLDTLFLAMRHLAHLQNPQAGLSLFLMCVLNFRSNRAADDELRSSLWD
jgi:hypothetical protein